MGKKTAILESQAEIKQRQQLQPGRTTIGNIVAAERRHRRDEQGEDYSQLRQEHANDEIAVGED